VWVKRPEAGRVSGKFVTHVAYGKGYVFREDVPSDIWCFFEEFGANAGWFWRRSLIQAAADKGVRSLVFGCGQVREVREDVRLRGPNDPSNW
jgi:hypothetical protein